MSCCFRPLREGLSALGSRMERRRGHWLDACGAGAGPAIVSVVANTPSGWHACGRQRVLVCLRQCRSQPGSSCLASFFRSFRYLKGCLASGGSAGCLCARIRLGFRCGCASMAHVRHRHTCCGGGSYLFGPKSRIDCVAQPPGVSGQGVFILRRCSPARAVRALGQHERLANA